MQKLTKSLLFATGALCFGVNANESLSAQKAVDEADYQLIFLLNEEAYGVDVADQAVLAVSPEAARPSIAGQLSDQPQLAIDLGSPKRVDYLISSNRLPNKVLQTLPIDDPERVLHQYVVATYGTPSDIKAVYQSTKLQVELDQEDAQNLGWRSPTMPIKHVEKNVKFGYSAIPNDTHYRTFQRPMMSGLMRFEQAWDYTTGYAKLGMVDSGIDENHSEFRHSSNKFNYLKRYSFKVNSVNSISIGSADEIPNSLGGKGHGSHVAGIMTATTNNNAGVSGVCWECSLSVAAMNPDYVKLTKAIRYLITTGVSAINMSMGSMHNCTTSQSSICQAIALAKKYNVQLIAASGNGDLHGAAPSNLNFPASHPDVLSVGAIDNRGNRMNLTSKWYSQMGNGSNQVDVMAYGVDVFSTFYRNSDWIPFNYAGGKTCKDSADSYVGYGRCTGTSMATPFITGLVGLMRSANPYLTNAQIKSYLKRAGNYTQRTDGGFTYKIPKADSVLRSILGTSKNKRVPLISLYSSSLKDHFYTVSPQAAAAASYNVVNNTYQPYTLTGRTASSAYSIYGYRNSNGATRAKANAYVYTTKHNPVNRSSNCELVPLYRLNYWVPGNADHVYTTELSGIDTLTGWGYKYEGIEGYIFPKHCPKPSGTVRLMRKYNASRDDHAIFPESMLSTMQSQGYTQNSGSDWLGYVYPL